LVVDQDDGSVIEIEQFHPIFLVGAD
jgi:hypothetical protein